MAKPKAMQAAETFYQHDLVVTTRTHEIEPYLIGDITSAIWRMIHQENAR